MSYRCLSKIVINSLRILIKHDVTSKKLVTAQGQLDNVSLKSASYGIGCGMLRGKKNWAGAPVSCMQKKIIIKKIIINV